MTLIERADRLEGGGDDLDCTLRGYPVDRRTADIAVDPGDLAKLFELPRADDRAALDHAPRRSRDGSDGRWDGVGHQGGFLDPQIRVDAQNAAHVPAEIDIHHVETAPRGSLRLLERVRIGERGEPTRLGELEKLQLAAEAHPLLLQESPEGAVDQDRGREVRHPEKPRLGNPIDEAGQGYSPIEDGAAAKQLNCRPRPSPRPGQIQDH